MACAQKENPKASRCDLSLENGGSQQKTMYEIETAD